MNHDAISVQMCRDAGMDDETIDIVMTRAKAQGKAEITGARQTIERWKERCLAAKREVADLKRDISDYIRIGNEQGAEIAQLREALKLALEYWADRQQRYKNRSPVWVQKARAALSGENNG